MTALIRRHVYPGLILTAVVSAALLFAPRLTAGDSATSGPAPATPTHPAPVPAPAQDAGAAKDSDGSKAPSPPLSHGPRGLVFPGVNVPPDVLADQQKEEKREEEIARARVDMAAKPSDPEPLGRLVDQLLQGHRPEEARDAAEDFVNRNVSVQGGYFALGRSLYWLGQYDLALLQFERAVSLDANNAPARLWRSRSLSTQGDHAGAIGELRRVIELNPDDASAVATLAYELEEAGKFAEAGKAWEKVAIMRDAKKLPNDASTMRFLLCRELARKGTSVTGLPASGVTLPLVSLRGVPGVKVRLNQRLDRTFLIDVSSQEMALTAACSRDLGLEEFGGPSYRENERVVGHPAVAVLDSVQIGQAAIIRVPASVNPGLQYPTTEIGGLLGRRFLAEFLVTIDYPQRTVTFAPRPANPIDGVPLCLNRALLAEARWGGKSAGRFLVDTSTYTPGPVSVLWSQDNLGISLATFGVRPILNRAYLFSFTMPEIEIAGVTWRNYPATAVDFRSLSEQISTELSGVLANSMLRDTRATFDLSHLRMRLERTKEQEFRTPSRSKPPAGATPTGTTTPPQPAEPKPQPAPGQPSGPAPAPSSGQPAPPSRPSHL